MGTSAAIIEIAQRSGIPNNPGSTFRPGATTKSGGKSHHADDNAVDFMGFNQDALAALFMGVPSLEVFHFSNATGKWYGKSKGKDVDPNKHPDLVNEHKNHLHVALGPDQVGPGSILDQLRKGLAAITPSLGIGAGALSGFIAAPGNVTDALTNVGTGIYSIAQSAVSVGALANTVTRAFLPTNILRGVFFLFGVMAILIGVWFLAREVKESKA